MAKSTLQGDNTEAQFKRGDEVYVPSCGLKGCITKVVDPPFQWMGLQYEVLLQNWTKTTYPEDSLQECFDIDDVFALCEKGNFASCEEFMIVNTLFKIDNVNSNTISTLRASRTQFKAYQFKPLLKFFASPEKRLLIADEVGLGKTIEAGHILLELKARKEFRNAIIVCPKSLREKWQTEMKRRFGLDFTIYGGEDSEGRKYPSINDLMNRYKTGYDVHAIVNYERIRHKERSKEEGPRRKQSLIGFLREKEIRQSVVICDESHRLRNHTFSYVGAKYLLQQSDAAIFLSATPIMLGESDLYRQMHLLCPEKYSEEQSFLNRMNQGRPFVEALNAMSAGVGLLSIWSELKDCEIIRIVKTRAGTSEEQIYSETVTVDEFFADDPVYKRIEKLFHDSDCAKTRVLLQQSLAKMSAIQNEFSRTTKRQIRNELSKVNERVPYTVKIRLTDEEKRISDDVLGKYDSPENSLGLIQIKRMVSSSVYAYCNKHEDLVKGIDAYADREDTKIKALAGEVLSPSKVNGYRHIGKVIVFAVFIDTLLYLRIRLEKLGVRCAVIDGSVEDRQAVIDNFRKDPAIRVLLSSEVGSEGLDMQFCDTIVNYDLPWNPMVVEQRIGRIDRIGQESESINIFNLVVKDSIIERIYDRLEERINIFRGSIGELEPILSAPYKDGKSIIEVHNDLEVMYYKKEISEEEVRRRNEEIAQAIENQKLTLESLSSEIKSTNIRMDSYYDEQIKLIQKRKAYVTGHELSNLLKRVLADVKSGCAQCVLGPDPDDSRIWELRIPQNSGDRNCLLGFLEEYAPQDSESAAPHKDFRDWIRGRSVLRMTFSQEVANEDSQIIFVNNYSPLIQSCNEFRVKSNIAVNKIFRMALVADGQNSVLKSGEKYFLLYYQLEISNPSEENGVSIKELHPILFDIDKENVVLDEDIVSAVCSKVQDEGLETSCPRVDEKHRGLVQKFKSLATMQIEEVTKEKKTEIDEQSNVERNRWIREFDKFYEQKINYCRDEIRKCKQAQVYGSSEKLNRQIAGYRGQITRLMQEQKEKIAKLGGESDVKISRREEFACYVTIV